MLVWITLPFYDFCCFRSVAVNSVFKLQFFTFIAINASCSGRHDVKQGNVNTLQHLQSDRRSRASIKHFLNLLIQFYLNNVTNLHQLTS